LGHTVNFKTTKLSFKSHKVKRNSPEEWAIFENTQEPIIEEDVFMIVQNIRKGRIRRTSMGEPPIFSGLLFCADCGGKMYFYRKRSFTPGQERFICSTYQKDRSCPIHYIRLNALEEVILRNLREAIAYVSRYENDFVREASEANSRERDRELAKKKDELAKAEKRITELDVVFKRIYEDNINGKLTDERFIKLSRDYEQEQDGLKAFVATASKEIKGQEQKRNSVKSFIAATKKYTDLKELDATVLREFIEKIYVSEKDKQTKTQEIKIVYNFIGDFDFDAANQKRKITPNAEKAAI
jgi:hypothetical protein